MSSSINTFCTCERDSKSDAWTCACGKHMSESQSGVLSCFFCGRKKEIRPHHASNCPKSMKQLKKRKKKAKALKKEKKNNVQQ